MPRIRWSGLPPALRDHLFDRLRERKITAEDLYQLKVWRESNPDAPDGLWYKAFGSFKICGDGKYPKTFLLRRPSSQRAEALRCSQSQFVFYPSRSRPDAYLCNRLAMSV
jgi:hypothetical protein